MLYRATDGEPALSSAGRRTGPIICRSKNRPSLLRPAQGRQPAFFAVESFRETSSTGRRYARPVTDATPAAAEDADWWHDGYLWYPRLSDDGRQRFDGNQWRSLHPGSRVARILAVAMLCLTPVVVFAGFIYIASDPAYPGQPEPPHQGLVGLGYVFWAPLWVSVLLVATRRVGTPGLHARRSRAVPRWSWEPPAGWPQPPSGWRPSPGWRPEPTWPAPPPDWRGWTRK